MRMYFYSNGQEKEGPVTLEELKQVYLQSKTLIWHEGLENWKEADTIEELRELFELRTPPIPDSEDELKLSEPELGDNEETVPPVTPTLDVKGVKTASDGWMVVGFILALLGGWIGMVMGLNYALGNYHTKTKTAGWVMTIVGIFSMAIWRSAR